MKKVQIILWAIVISMATISCKKCITCHTEGNGGADPQTYCSGNTAEINTFTDTYKAKHWGYDTHGLCQ